MNDSSTRSAREVLGVIGAGLILRPCKNLLFFLAMCFRWLSIKDWNRLLIFVANLFQAGTAETVLVAVLQLVSLVRGKLHIRAPTTGESGAAGKIVAARFADRRFLPAVTDKYGHRF